MDLIYKDREWLEYQYVKLHRHITEIAKDAGVHYNTIRWWLRKHGIERQYYFEMVFKCQFCGKAFKPKYRPQASCIPKFCSNKCYHDSTKKGVVNTCVNCGKKFYIYNCRKDQQYCSLKCRKEYKQVKKICPRCKKPFWVYKTGADRYTYCSIACSRAKTIRRKCLRCGKIFTAKREDIRYCSELCRRPPVYIQCLRCGKEFRVSPSLKEEKQFCSFRCYRKYTGETKPEKKMRLLLEQKKIDYIQEFQIGSYCIDFFLPNQELCIEVDGKYWHSTSHMKKHDKKRDSLLKNNGFGVIRILEDQINRAPEKCLNIILN